MLIYLWIIALWNAPELLVDNNRWFQNSLNNDSDTPTRESLTNLFTAFDLSMHVEDETRVYRFCEFRIEIL